MTDNKCLKPEEHKDMMEKMHTCKKRGPILPSIVGFPSKPSNMTHPLAKAGGKPAFVLTWR